MIKQKFFLTDNYKIVKKLSSDKIKTVYHLRSKDTHENFIAKQFYISDMDQYLDFESLLSSLLDLNRSELQGLTPLVEYHCRNISEEKNELILVYKKYVSSLHEQISILGSRVKFDYESAYGIFSDLCHCVKSVHEKNLLFLALNPKNILYRSDGVYLMNDAIFNKVCMKVVKVKEVKVMQKRLDKFPEFAGKKEHNICIFDGTYDTKTEVSHLNRLY